jgi:hypothetical protein
MRIRGETSSDAQQRASRTAVYGGRRKAFPNAVRGYCGQGRTVGLCCAEKHRGKRLPVVSPLVTLWERHNHVARVGKGSEDAAVGEHDGITKAQIPGHTRNIVTPPRGTERGRVARKAPKKRGCSHDLRTLLLAGNPRPRRVYPTGA